MGWDEAARKAGAVWVQLPGRPPRLLWCAWHDDAVHVVVGGPEQDLPGADGATSARLHVRRERGAALEAVVDVAVQRLSPGTGQWDAAVPVLLAARLHVPAGEDRAARWAQESAVLRLSAS